MRGVVAAGHPLTAEAGAAILRDGGNAVDAAVCAVLASFAVESPLTGFGAGGHMMVHQGGETTLIDFFVAAPGLDRIERATELVPVPVRFDAETTQTFFVGPASCGVPGTAAGLAHALERFGTRPLGELVGPGVRLAREGAPINRGHVAAAISDFVVANGGLIGPGDLASYEAIERKPIDAPFRGTQVLTNPPPSSGGILIAYTLGLLERFGPQSGPEQLVLAMEGANSRRDLAFAESLYEEGMEVGFLDPIGLDLAAADLLGSTTHISVLDGDGNCAAVTCSNGSGSGVLVPGTGVILNNMLGEEDLNPAGFHSIAPGRRVPSMMAPTVVLRDGEIVLALGSAGSNRIRSAILQTVVRAIEQGFPVAAAVEAPRLHFEQGIVQAEKGVDPAALDRLEQRGWEVARWPSLNLFFGGVQAVSRDPATGELSGGGDPRRGGAVAYAE